MLNKKNVTAAKVGSFSETKIQKEYFEALIDIARELNLPLVLHPPPSPNPPLYPDSSLPPTTATITPDEPMSVGFSKAEVCS